MPTREEYLNNARFISDARAFLQERTGDFYRDPEEVLDNFLEQRRGAVVNEVSMLRDLEYAQEASDNSKQRFARLLDDFDEYDDGMSFGAIYDYGKGLATSPLTVGAGALSFGTGAIAKTGAQLAGRQAAMMGLRKLLVPSTVGGAVRGATLAAAEGAATEEIYQRTREEVGAGREEGQVGLVAGIAAGIGGPLGAVAGKLGAGQAAKAAATFTEADKARAAMAATQKEAVDNVRSLVEAQKAGQQLSKEEAKRALDPDWVAAGDKLMESLNENTALTARLPKETIEAISIAAAEVASKLTKKPGERITETIAGGIADGKISVEAFSEILQKYKITREQFSAAYMADISDAAKKLRMQGVAKQKIGEFNAKLDAVANGKYMDITPEEMTEIIQNPHIGMGFLKGLDRLRLGMMTSQLATTVRNTAGGGFRLAVDAFEAGVDNVVRKATGRSARPSALLDSATSTKFMINQRDASIIQMLFEETMPTKARRLFFDAADAEARISRSTLSGQKTSKAETGMAWIGHKVNFLNTVSDNIFKRAMFSASLDRQLRAIGKEGVMDYVRAGKFADIDEAVIKKAMDDALDFTYQKMPDSSTIAGKLGSDFIGMHRSAPFLISAFMPFPRFIANQLKFVHEHSIIMPLLTSGLGLTKMPEKYVAKSVSGMAMFGAAVAFRSQQPADSKWNQYIDDQGQIKELSPILGPFAPFMIAADFTVRHYRGDDSRKLSTYISETAKALGTPRMAPSAGWAPIDKFIDDLADDKLIRGWGRFAGDVLGTYTMPAAMVRDLAAAVNPDYRGVREMDELLPSSGDDLIDWWQYTMHYASRNLPMEVGTEGGAPVQFSPTAEGGLRRYNALEKQFTGVATYAPKTVLQAELDRLGMDRRDIIPYESDPLKAQTQEALMGGGFEKQQSLSSIMSSYIYSDDYQNLPVEERRLALTNKIKSVMKDQGYAEKATALMEYDIAEDKPMQYTQSARIAFEKLSPELRKKIEREWLNSEEYITQLINNPNMDVDMSIYESGAYDWAMEAVKKFR